MKPDKIYYPKAGETPPDIVACLFHQTVAATMKHTVKERKGFMTVQYGLCADCEIARRTDPNFVLHIDAMICKRLEALEAEKIKEGLANGSNN